MKHCLALVLALILTALLGGCASVQPQVAPDDILPVPDRFSLYPQGEPMDRYWWHALQSAELNDLVDTALNNDLSIAAAQARLKQADIQIKQARAALVPAVTLDSSAGISRIHQDTASTANTGILPNTAFTPGQTIERESYSLGLAASYELDLWGGIRARRRAILRQAEAQREALAVARLTVAATVCQTWIDLVATRKTHALLDDQLEANRKLLELVEMRFRRSMATAVDLSRQRQSVAAIEAAIPTVTATEQTLAHALAILLGRMPTDPPAVNVTQLPTLTPMPETGLPAEVLARRPDVRQSGARLRASAEAVEVARADRLPTLRLTGSAAYSASSTAGLFDNWLANLAANLTGPIFDAGLRKAEEARLDAVREEALIGYKQTVLNAIRDVEDALARETAQKTHLDARQRQLDAARTALTEQHARYERGQDTYIRVLEQQISVWTLEREYIQAEANLLKYRIALYRAIAGNINEDETP